MVYTIYVKFKKHKTNNLFCVYDNKQKRYKTLCSFLDDSYNRVLYRDCYIIKDKLGNCILQEKFDSIEKACKEYGIENVKRFGEYSVIKNKENK